MDEQKNDGQCRDKQKDGEISGYMTKYMDEQLDIQMNGLVDERFDE